MNKKCVKSVFSKLSDHARQFSVPAVLQLLASSAFQLPYTSRPNSWSVAICHSLFTGACRTQVQFVVPGPIECGHVDRHCTSGIDVSVLMNTFAPPNFSTTLAE
jgi:hypothetical protein